MGYHVLRKRVTHLRPRTKYVPFSPVREKGTKERTFVRAELTPYKSDIGTVSKVSIGTRSSGGIVMLSAKMWLVEYRRRHCAPLNMAECAQKAGVFLFDMGVYVTVNRHANKRKWTADEVRQWYQTTGAFTYANPDDLNIIVKKPGREGFTVNWANPKSYLIQGAILAIVFTIIFLLK